MSTFALEVQGCSRRFRSRKGTVQALQDVSFQVPEGACCGLLGPNGAGKSTLIRILANVLRPDAGRIYVLGEPLRWGRHAYKRQVGFMLEDLALMERLTGREQLELAARLYGLSPEQAAATIEALGAPSRSPRRSIAGSKPIRGACAASLPSCWRCCTGRGCSCSTSPSKPWTRRHLRPPSPCCRRATAKVPRS